MSFLKESLEKRIQELRTSIESQRTELAAYEQVLALESGKPIRSQAAPTVVKTAVTKAPVKKAAAAAPKAPAPKPPAPTSGAAITAPFSGSRSEFVVAVLKQRGAAGAFPVEISKAFAERKIAISKNLVYNALSEMFKKKKVRKAGGKYYLVSGAAPTAAPAASPAPKKNSRISEEGMRRIVAATKKRWAAVRAAKAKAAAH